MKKILFWFFGVILLFATISTPIQKNSGSVKSEAYDSGFLVGQIVGKGLLLFLGIYLIGRGFAVSKQEKIEKSLNATQNINQK